MRWLILAVAGCLLAATRFALLIWMLWLLTKPQTSCWLHRLRVVNGERQSVSKIEQLLRLTSTPWFREIVAYLEKETSTARRVGRPRLHTVADWVVFWLAAELKGGVRRRP